MKNYEAKKISAFAGCATMLVMLLGIGRDAWGVKISLQTEFQAASKMSDVIPRYASNDRYWDDLFEKFKETLKLAPASTEGGRNALLIDERLENFPVSWNPGISVSENVNSMKRLMPNELAHIKNHFYRAGNKSTYFFDDNDECNTNDEKFIERLKNVLNNLGTVLSRQYFVDDNDLPCLDVIVAAKPGTMTYKKQNGKREKTCSRVTLRFHLRKDSYYTRDESKYCWQLCSVFPLEDDRPSEKENDRIVFDFGGRDYRYYKKIADFLPVMGRDPRDNNKLICFHQRSFIDSACKKRDLVDKNGVKVLNPMLNRWIDIERPDGLQLNDLCNSLGIQTNDGVYNIVMQENIYPVEINEITGLVKTDEGLWSITEKCFFHEYIDQKSKLETLSKKMGELEEKCEGFVNRKKSISCIENFLQECEEDRKRLEDLVNRNDKEGIERKYNRLKGLSEKLQDDGNDVFKNIQNENERRREIQSEIDRTWNQIDKEITLKKTSAQKQELRRQKMRAEDKIRIKDLEEIQELIKDEKNQWSALLKKSTDTKKTSKK